MRLAGAAQRLTILVGESDRLHHHAWTSEILNRAHRAGLAGESVFRGTRGSGASGLVHTARVLSLSDDLPMAVVIVDAAKQIQQFLPQLDEPITEGLMIIDDVEVIRHVGWSHHDPDDAADPEAPEGRPGQSGGIG